ncbi:MAG: hypothetical protein QOF63_1104, partial [Thermoanaerobaculia bacterium]|nr:hypothetical protein [Thermoanaerobaculia bacterium]
MVSIVKGECEILMRTREDAVRLLAYKEACTDAAIEALTSFAASSRDPQVLSDLAAAYYIRAQRKDDPSDLVRALGVAEEAAKR